MLELGRKSEILHKGLSKVINNSDIDKVFIQGTKTLANFQKNSYKEAWKHFSTRRRCRLYFK